MEKYRKQLSFLSSGKINIFEKKLYGNSFFPLQMKIGEIDFRISFSRFKMDFILYYAKEGYCYNENLLDNIFFFFKRCFNQFSSYRLYISIQQNRGIVTY